MRLVSSSALLSEGKHPEQIRGPAVLAGSSHVCSFREAKPNKNRQAGGVEELF